MYLQRRVLFGAYDHAEERAEHPQQLILLLLPPPGRRRSRRRQVGAQGAEALGVVLLELPAAFQVRRERTDLQIPTTTNRRLSASRYKRHD